MLTAFACMDDLMFLSRIAEAARATDVPLRSLKDPAKLLAAVSEASNPAVFLDLDSQRLDAVAFARTLRKAVPPVTCRIYAFVSHVNEDRISAAKPGLFDRVFSRGEFVRALPALLGASGKAPTP